MRNFPLTLAALSLTTSLLASACALEEGDELDDVEIGETEHALLDPDETFAGSGIKEIAVAETEGVEAVVKGYSGTTYGVGGTVINGQARMAIRFVRNDGSYASRNVVPDGHSIAWGRAAVNVGGFPNEVVMAVGAAGELADRKLAVALMTSSGLDASYGGGDGMAVFNVSTSEPYEEGTAMAVDPEISRVYVGGNACHSHPTNGVACRPFIVRFTAAGAWDSGYGVKYFALPTTPFYSEELKGLAVDGDGGVIVVTEQLRSYASSDVVVRRITPTALDHGFNNGTGLQRFQFATAEGVAIDPGTDRIVVAGNDLDETKTYVWQLSYNGLRIPNFGGTFNGGSSGFAIIDFTSRADERLGDIKIDDRGRIILLGTGATPAVASFTVVRLLANGQPDTTFEGDDGKDFITFPGSPDGSVGMSLFVDSLDDTIVAAGLGLSDATEKMVFARIANP